MSPLGVHGEELREGESRRAEALGWNGEGSELPSGRVARRIPERPGEEGAKKGRQSREKRREGKKDTCIQRGYKVPLPCRHFRRDRFPSSPLGCTAAAGPRQTEPPTRRSEPWRDTTRPNTTTSCWCWCCWCCCYHGTSAASRARRPPPIPSHPSIHPSHLIPPPFLHTHSLSLSCPQSAVAITTAIPPPPPSPPAGIVCASFSSLLGRPCIVHCCCLDIRFRPHRWLRLPIAGRPLIFAIIAILSLPPVPAIYLLSLRVCRPAPIARRCREPLFCPSCCRRRHPSIHPSHPPTPRDLPGRHRNNPSIHTSVHTSPPLATRAPSHRDAH